MTYHPHVDEVKHSVFLRIFSRSLLFIFFALILSACHRHEEMTGVGISGFGHLGKSIGIPTFSVNQGWGGDADGLDGGGGIVCCAMVPDKWRPGLVANVEWEECDTSNILFDEKGCHIDPDTKKTCIKSWHKATVPIPKYDEPGTLMVHFFPEHQIAVVVSRVGPGNPSYPWPVMKGYYPSYSPAWARAEALGVMDRPHYAEDCK